MGFFGDAEAARQAFRRLQDEGYLRFEDQPLETRDGRRIDVEFVCNVYPVGSRDMIQCNIRDVSDRKRAEALQREAEGLLRQLLAYSRQQVLNPKSVDVNELVAKVGRLLEGLTGDDIELVEDLAPGLGRVRADSGQIEQALLNLAVNARDSLPGGGRITFRTRMITQVGDEGGIEGRSASAQPYALVTISDSGAGMDKTAQERIFDPFFLSRGKVGMDGLALSMVQGIIAQSGGLVKVESAPGQGTSFKVYLPLAEAGERKP